MKLAVKNIRINEYTQDDDEVPEGTRYAFWRIVEYTGAGWFAWPTLYRTREAAKERVESIMESQNG
jgi:hypothetical protein